MLIFDLKQIGNNLFKIRRRLGLTQAEAAERSGLSDRTYADIERGEVSMRLGTLLQICDALHITPNEILTHTDDDDFAEEGRMVLRLQQHSKTVRKTAVCIVDAYLNSVIDSNN